MSHLRPRPALTVDTVVLYGEYILLVQRAGEPFARRWALPGGHVYENEKLVDAAARELAEETGLALRAFDFVQVGAFGDPGRDPRGWTVSIAFMTHLMPQPGGPPMVRPASDARDACWWPLAHLPTLAFDHFDMVQAAMNRRSRA